MQDDQFTRVGRLLHMSQEETLRLSKRGDKVGVPLSRVLEETALLRAKADEAEKSAANASYEARARQYEAAAQELRLSVKERAWQILDEYDAKLEEEKEEDEV
ncbi:MAG: hypothetical protein ACRDLL_16785 [Solirubrobacterales bacterium]